MEIEVGFHSKVTDIQSFLLSYSWVEEGRDFFRALAEYLAVLLDADYICIDKLHGDLEAETVAVWFDGHFDDNYRYKLQDTPCGKVLANEVCTIAQDVSNLFPKDKFLKDMCAESYAGITLHDSYGRPVGLIAVISRKPSPDMDAAETILKMVAIRAAAELEHRKTVRSFEGLALSTHHIVSATDETELLKLACRTIIDYCDYSMMWIGMANDDASKSITPVASAGFEEGYLEKLNLTWADTERGRGPSGTAVRVGQPVLCMNTQTDPCFLPWRKDASERGYHSNMAIPLIAGTRAIGVVSVYGTTPDYFSVEDMHLLTLFSNDLSAGINAIRMKAERDRMMYELHMANELLEVTVSERTSILLETNRKLREEVEISTKKEKLLREAELKYRTVADFTYDGESWLGTDGRYIYISPSFERLTGYPAEAFLANSSLSYTIAHPEDRERVEKHFDHIMLPNDDICSMQFRIITKSGETRWIGHACQPVYNAEGEWIGQRSSNRDITTEKQAEERLLNSQKQLRAFTSRLDEIAEEERKNIARHIHDELGHLLTALKFDLDNIAREKSRMIGDLEADFTSVDTLISSLINSVRTISTELRPEILDHLGLLPALEWQIREFRKRTKLCCEYKIDDLKHQFSSRETTVIYRILQEALTNIARHAEAQHVHIKILEKDNTLLMKVKDNGKGFVTVGNSGIEALGLLGMKERALSIGGNITINSSPGNGTIVTFKLPFT